jgi:hypothetical protein
MKGLVSLAFLFGLASTAALADNNCERSREYLIGGLAGDLEMSAQTYDTLFKICIATAAMPNVKDAYVLKDGGIAVIPKQDTIPATAGTLSQFCEANPTATLRFVTRRELALGKTMSAIVQTSSSSATPCKKIKGLTD